MAWYKWLRGWLQKLGLETYYIILVWVYLLLSWLPTHPDQTALISSFFFLFMPFMLPVLTLILLWESWLEFTRQRFYYSNEYCLVEIRLPDEITQSPMAAELFIRSMYDVGGIDGLIDEYIRGKTRPWYSLEIVSTEGRVRFYVWMRKRYKGFIESQIYAHYPTVQVVEVPDYTLAVPYDPAVIDIWGIDQKLQKPDPYPITTYVEARMDKPDLKEEFKQDPIISLLEFFGTMREGEHGWVQLIIRAHGPGNVASWSEDALGEEVSVDKWAEHEKEKLLQKTVIDEKDKPNYSKLSQGDKDRIDSMERKLNKQAFDVGIRAVYISRKEKTDGSKRVGFPTSFRAFEHGSEGRGLNGFKPIFYIGPFDYPWQDFMGIRRALLRRKMYRGYVTRQYFFPPFKNRHIVLNLEELATVFHLPGKVARTPTLERMLSRRSEAPANLPI